MNRFDRSITGNVTSVTRVLSCNTRLDRVVRDRTARRHKISGQSIFQTIVVYVKYECKRTRRRCNVKNRQKWNMPEVVFSRVRNGETK